MPRSWDDLTANKGVTRETFKGVRMLMIVAVALVWGLVAFSLELSWLDSVIGGAVIGALSGWVVAVREIK